MFVCLERFLRTYWPTLFKTEQAYIKEIKKMDDIVKSLNGIIASKNRMLDHLENKIKLKSGHYDDLSSRYTRALNILSQYIEKYEPNQGIQTEAEDDGETAGNP